MISENGFGIQEKNEKSNSIEKLKSEKNEFGKQEAGVVLDYLSRAGEICLSWRLDESLYGFLSGKSRFEEFDKDNLGLKKWEKDYNSYIAHQERHNTIGEGKAFWEGRSWLFFDTKKISSRRKREDIKYRFYLNPKKEKVIDVFDGVIMDLLKDQDICFQTKTHRMSKEGAPKQADGAFDKMVIYSDEKSVDKIIERLSEYLKKNNSSFQDEELPFTVKLKDDSRREMRGIGIASETDGLNGERITFTELQARIISDAIRNLQSKINSNEGYFNNLSKAGYGNVAQWLKRLKSYALIRLRAGKTIEIHEIAKAIMGTKNGKEEFIEYFPDLYNISAKKHGLDVHNIAFFEKN